VASGILSMASPRTVFPIPLLTLSSVLGESIVLVRLTVWLILDPSMLTKRLVVARLYLLLPTLYMIGLPKFQRFMVRLLPWKSIREIVRHVDFIYNTSVDIIKSRKAALQSGKEVMDRQVGRGKDIISVLC
jgi:hypothetical protein